MQTNSVDQRLAGLSLAVEQKIHIIQQLLQQICPRLPLDIEETEKKIDCDLNSTVYSYEIPGRRFRKRSQMSNLLSKIRQNQPQEEKSEEDEANDGATLRYFNCNVRCFRCKKLGHYSSYCPQQHLCIYCLSTLHPYERCPQKVVCFRCYHVGHVIGECREMEGQFCKSCRRKHKGDCCFLARISDQQKEVFDCGYLQRDQEIICIACGKIGHLNCQWTNEIQ